MCSWRPARILEARAIMPESTQMRSGTSSAARARGSSGVAWSPWRGRGRKKTVGSRAARHIGPCSRSTPALRSAPASRSP